MKVQNSRRNPAFFVNTQHSPIGAFASFTLGAKGPQGGLGLELGRPADQNVFVGLEESKGGAFRLLPFCEIPSGKVPTGVDEFGRKHSKPERTYEAIPDREIERFLTPSTDVWKTRDFEFSIHSPVMAVPDPERAGRDEMMRALAPVVTATLRIDNRAGKKGRRFFFGFSEGGGSRSIRRIYDHPKRRDVRGVAYGDSFGIATNSPGVFPGQGFRVDEILAMADLPNCEYGLGRVGLLVGTVPAGVEATYQFAICFHRPGVATTGMETKYLYRRFFPTLEAVAVYALRNFSEIHERGNEFDQTVAKAGLSPDRHFMLSQAVHSYYGSTELLEAKDGPWWVVNEGEYRMMNTLDLTVDQLWFEMRMNPWTVRNTLDRFRQRYSFTDKLRLPGDDREFPGGLAFTHDMGVANHFSPPGLSSYEMVGVSGTFASMAHEELLNWIICALVLAKHPEHSRWGAEQEAILSKALESLMRRDHPNPKLRNGIMDADTNRCGAGSEITTYDSLDHALCGARASVYLGVKSWGAYVGLADYFDSLNNVRLARRAQAQADLVVQTICDSVRPDGSLPALLGGGGSTLVIPAIEGLIVPHQLGLFEALNPEGRYGVFLRTLKRHFTVALDSGECHFPDGGWKISSTSDNSWLSKIYLNQFLAEHVLHAVSTKESFRADRAHAQWSRSEENSYWAWSDQILNGKAIGSKYYPRGVTCILWIE